MTKKLVTTMKIKQGVMFLVALATAIGLLGVSTAINSYVLVQVNTSVNTSPAAVALIASSLGLFTTLLTWAAIVILIICASYVVRTMQGGKGAF
jgi:hypothetical protein